MPSRNVSRRLSTLQRRYPPIEAPPPAAEPERAASATEPTEGDEPQPEQPSVNRDTRTIEAPFGLNLRALELAVRSFRNDGFTDRDSIRCWSSDDGSVTAIAVVRQQTPEYATGGRIEGPSGTAPDRSVPTQTNLVIHPDPPSDATRAILESMSRRARVQQHRP